MATAIRVIGYIALLIGAALVLAGTYGFWLKQGWSGVQELYSPFNVVGWIVTVITLAPGWLLIMLAKRLDRRKENA